jgi:formylglycine-generating enzyme required for sulfatase activity/uncharacterized caspase-like protein
MARIAFILLLCLLLSPSHALAQKRVALVVGNSAYRYTSELVNPKNDSADMVAVLRKHGFEVIEGVDLDKAAFDRKVGDFASALRGADTGVFFYAGHGLQVGGQNYLVPIDAKAEEEVRLDLEMVRVDVVHRIMERQTETNVLFLDACRDNPLARNLARSMGTRSAAVGHGLARVDAGVGTLISFATQPGNVAFDGAGRNSPYTDALVKHLAAPKEDLSAILIDVRNDVMQASGGKQVPWEHVALRARFYFGPPPKGADPAGLTPGHNGTSAAALEWARVDKSSLAELRTFLRRHQQSPEADYAQARIEELERPKIALTTPPSAAPAAPPPNAPGKAPEPATAAPNTARAPAPLTAAEEQALNPKDSFKECPECPEMVVVPAGEFTMGSVRAEEGRDTTEGPRHQVIIARPFAVGKYEVTFAEWDACAAEDGCDHRHPGDQFRGRDRREPLISVSWDRFVKEYLPWLSHKTGKTYRLLTEAEWEYAARAGTKTPFWWGPSISTSQANYEVNSKFYFFGRGYDFGGLADPLGSRPLRTLPVDSFAANPWGLHNVHGNVWEWVQDCWHYNYDGAPSDGSGMVTGNCDSRVLRGGSWGDNPRDLRSATRHYDLRATPSRLYGFRVARTF